jgi:hypothetical protein
VCEGQGGGRKRSEESGYREDQKKVGRTVGRGYRQHRGVGEESK